MASVADLRAAVAAETSTRPGRVKHYSRRLQEAGILPLASGSHVPAVRIEHLAALLLVVAVDCEVKNTVPVVQTYSDLRHNGVDVRQMPEAIRPPTQNARDFIEHLLHSFASGDAADQALNARVAVEVVSTWPEIAIHDPSDNSVLRFVEPGQLPTHWQSDALRTSTTITGRSLQRLVRTLQLTR